MLNLSPYGVAVSVRRQWEDKLIRKRFFWFLWAAHPCSSSRWWYNQETEDKGKAAERHRRKASGLRDFLRQRGRRQNYKTSILSFARYTALPPKQCFVRSAAGNTKHFAGDRNENNLYLSVQSYLRNVQCRWLRFCAGS